MCRVKISTYNFEHAANLTGTHQECYLLLNSAASSKFLLGLSAAYLSLDLLSMGTLS